MMDSDNALAELLLQRITGKLMQTASGGQRPSAAATPAEPPKMSEAEKAAKVTSIISEAYAMPNVPEHVRRRCAKRRIEAEYGAECASKYLRGRKRTRVPAESADTTTASVAAPVATPAPTPAAAAPTPVEPPAPEPVAEPPRLPLEAQLRELLSGAAQ